jgi:molecular chaperone GrpE
VSPDGSGFGRGPDEPDRVIIRDKRRVDPETGAARVPDPDPDPTPDRATFGGLTPQEVAQSEEVAALQAQVEERTADLQRVQAEYANYRKRSERDRLAAGEQAVGRVLIELLPVLDDIERARSHGDLNGALKAVADQLDGIFAKLGLEPFAEVGDPFDPAIHEAVLHDESDEVTVATATTIMRPGYRLHERLLRPAMVGVTEPAAAGTPLPPDGESEDQAE